jgi:hypothetical protein
MRGRLVKWSDRLADDWDDVPRFPPLPVVPDDLAGDVVQEDLADGAAIRLEGDSDAYLHAEFVIDLERAR